MWYAKMHERNLVIAEAPTERECRALTEALKIWDMKPGTVAPYYYTSIPPVDCSICNGDGKISDGYEKFPCGHCEGTGYELDRV